MVQRCQVAKMQHPTVIGREEGLSAAAKKTPRMFDTWIVSTRRAIKKIRGQLQNYGKMPRVYWKLNLVDLRQEIRLFCARVDIKTKLGYV